MSLEETKANNARIQEVAGEILVQISALTTEKDHDVILIGAALAVAMAYASSSGTPHPLKMIHDILDALYGNAGG